MLIFGLNLLIYYKELYLHKVTICKSENWVSKYNNKNK